MDLTLVTGNTNKLKEIQSILFDFNILNEKIDLVEIQSFNLKEVCEHKARQAYNILKKPIIVEDTGFYLEEFNGLPGPFIKFFLEKLGRNAPVKLLKNSKNRLASSKVVACYFDGENLIFGEGKIEGKVNYSDGSEECFGFDCCFIPNGYDKTIFELGMEFKNSNSHRALALKDLKKKLKNLN